MTSHELADALLQFSEVPMVSEEALRDVERRGVAKLDSALPSPLGDPLGTMVAGDRMRFSLREFVHRIETLLAEEQERPLPNNALIDMLCESVRLARENAAPVPSVQAAHPGQAVELAREIEGLARKKVVTLTLIEEKARQLVAILEPRSATKGPT